MMAGYTRQRKTQAGGKYYVEGIPSWEMCDKMYGYGGIGAGWILVPNWSMINSVENMKLGWLAKLVAFRGAYVPHNDTT